MVVSAKSRKTGGNKGMSWAAMNRRQLHPKTLEAMQEILAKEEKELERMNEVQKSLHYSFKAIEQAQRELLTVQIRERRFRHIYQEDIPTPKK